MQPGKKGFQKRLTKQSLPDLHVIYKYIILKLHVNKLHINPSSPDYTMWHKIFNVFDHEIKNFQGSMG